MNKIWALKPGGISIMSSEAILGSKYLAVSSSFRFFERTSILESFGKSKVAILIFIVCFSLN
jgi:hypothetical protein